MNPAGRGSERGAAGEDKIRIKVSADKHSLNMIRQAIGDAMKTRGFSTLKTAGMEVSVIEHCENLIKHVYAAGGGGISIEMKLKYPVAMVRITDTGPEFNMLEAKLPALSGRIAKGLGGKMGIRTILLMCDEVKYRRRGSVNENVFIIRDGNGRS
jgi:anti-sigma regulatory factor (Ser/Thr protein kinase)